MNRIIDIFSRYFVGCLLIFSGLIKLNDPIGTQIKLEEYFEVFATDISASFHSFIPWALELGLFMIVLEILLGVAILIYWRMNITMWITLLMMLFFTFLTFYSAYFNKVTDCGCFGDFIKFSPWGSFTKDIILDVFIFHLFWYRTFYHPNTRYSSGDSTVLAVALVSLTIGFYVIRHLPLFDFRPYKIGASIPLQMIPKEEPKFEYVFIKEGKKFTSSEFLLEEDGYTYVSSRVTNESKSRPVITDFSVHTSVGEDYTNEIFKGNKLIIVIFDVALASEKNIQKFKTLVHDLNGQVDAVILTASGSIEIDALRHKHQLAIPFYFSDKVVLKTIIRANPGITLWRDGVVLGKWHHNDTPLPIEINKLLKKKP